MNTLEKEKRIAVWALRLLAVACAIYVAWNTVSVLLDWLFRDYMIHSFYIDFGHFAKVLTLGTGFYICSVYLRIKGW